jgi:predicted nucleotidyltransferase
VGKITTQELLDQRKAIEKVAAENGITIIGFFGSVANEADPLPLKAGQNVDLQILIALGFGGSALDIIKFEMELEKLFICKTVEIESATEAGLVTSLAQGLITEEQKTTISKSAHTHTFDYLAGTCKDMCAKKGSDCLQQNQIRRRKMPMLTDVIEYIRQNKTEVIKINLGGYTLAPDDLRTLAAALSCNSHIQFVNLSDNGITDEGAQILATSALGAVVALDLSRNNITATGYEHFVANKTLLRLILSESNIEDQAVIKLAENATLQHLDLRGNKITDIGAEVLAGNCRIEELFLCGNQITSIGANALLSNPRFKVLYLGRNKIRDLDKKVLSENKTLRELSLDSNPIDKQLIVILAQCLSLEKLSLCSLDLEDEDAKQFVDSLSLTTLYLTGNKFTDEGARTLMSNPGLTQISLGQNELKETPCLIRR